MALNSAPDSLPIPFPLSNPDKRKLKGMAQRMEPTLKLGRAGLSDGFLRSVSEALDLHELVKVRFDEFKEQKHELMPLMAQRTGSELIMQVGHVAVLWKRNPDEAKRKIRF